MVDGPAVGGLAVALTGGLVEVEGAREEEATAGLVPVALGAGGLEVPEGLAAAEVVTGLVATATFFVAVDDSASPDGAARLVAGAVFGAGAAFGGALGGISAGILGEGEGEGCTGGIARNLTD